MPATKKPMAKRGNNVLLWATVVLVGLLILKFFWTLIVYRVPLGFDVGLYRYLFIRHAAGLPPFVMATMDPWAQGHPLGLFFFTTLLLKAGMPVDWLLGWVWNLVPVVVAMLLAWVIGKREGRAVGVLVLLAALMSLAYFDGFALMYWKTYAALGWCVLTYHLLENRSWLAILTGVLTVATHHQTGLLFGLSFLMWALHEAYVRRSFTPLIVGIVVCVLGLLAYMPVWDTAVLVHLPTLLGAPSSGGNFPSPLYYIHTSGIFLTLGALGFFVSLKRERWTLWQLSLLWSLAFVLLHSIFYRRFFLQLDFFLMPFVAMGIHALWRYYTERSIRGVFAFGIALQAVMTCSFMVLRTPIIDAATFADVQKLDTTVPLNAYVISLDPQTTPFVRGWLPDRRVVGPGLLDGDWNAEQWQTFLLGTHEERQHLLTRLPGDVYIYASPSFIGYYGASADAFLQDCCFTSIGSENLYKAVCREGIME